MCVGDGVEEGYDDGKEEEYVILKFLFVDVELVILVVVVVVEEKGEWF